MRKAVVLLLGMVASVHAVIIADFETGFDDFLPNFTPAPILSIAAEPAGAITSGTHCLKIATTGINYWALKWTPSTIPSQLGVLSFDTTMFVSDWPTMPWTKFPDKLSLVTNKNGWQEIQLTSANWKWRDPSNITPCNPDWGAWEGDAAKTCTVDLSGYSMEGVTSLSICFSINCGTAGTFYLDNVQLVPEPASLLLLGLGGLTLRKRTK
jgi:hypothetical protein